MRRALHYDPYSLPVVRTTGGVLPQDQAYDPYAPPVGGLPFLRDETPVEWVTATDLSTGALSWVPRQLCELDYRVEERLTVPLFRASSNGLASGNTVAEAILHGLCEVIERDAMWRNQGARRDPDRHIRLETIDSGLAQRVLERFARAGMVTEVVDVSGPTGLPCFAAYVSHASAPARYFGAGCHPSRSTALLRALTEAAQSRLGYIAGSRDDLYRATYAPVPHTLAQPERDEAQPEPPRRRFRSAPTLARQGVPALLREIVGRVRAVTGAAPLAVDLRRPEFDLPVVYVVAPGLQLIPPQRQ
jgi:ribosomal protein S12 methylthiotransferase accessory factor